MTKQSNVGNYIKLGIGILMIIICSLIFVNSLAEFIYYSQAKWEFDNSKTLGDALSTNKEVPGREPLDNPYPYNNLNTRGFHHTSVTEAGSLGFYNTTGIQLYFFAYDFGEKKFESEVELQNYIKSDIEAIEGHEYSIVIYEYLTDYDYKSPYYYYESDCTYYGSEVVKYLTSEDLEMIRYFRENGYDLWDYSNYQSKIWIEAGNAIANGYNTGDFVTVRDIMSGSQRYSEEITVFGVMSVIFFFLDILGFVLIVLGIRGIIRVNKINIELAEAEVELKEATATRIILDADIDEISSKADEDLVNKYNK